MKPGDKVIFKDPSNTSWKQGIKIIKTVYTQPAVTFASFIDDMTGYSIDQLILVEEGPQSLLEKENAALRAKIKELEQKLTNT